MAAPPEHPAATTSPEHATVSKRLPRRGTPRSPARATNRTADPPSRVILPVRHTPWTRGDLDDCVERTLTSELLDLEDVHVERLPMVFLIEAHESPGPMLEVVRRAALALEEGIEDQFPILHHQMGPVWTGTLQTIFTEHAAVA